MTDQILVSFARNRKGEWVADILREVEKGYDYLGAMHGPAAKDLYTMLTGGDSHEHREAV